jgi:hypothetical protein
MLVSVAQSGFEGVIASRALRAATGGESFSLSTKTPSSPRKMKFQSRGLMIKTRTAGKIFRARSDATKMVGFISDAALFQALAVQWKRETAVFPSVMEQARHPAYLRIMAMGTRAIPLILAQLKREGDMPYHWFVALTYVTGGENPVPDDDRGDVLKMRDAWLRWGMANGYAA